MTVLTVTKKYINKFHLRLLWLSFVWITSSSVPSVSTLGMYLCMTRLAQGNQIAPIMCATFRKWNLVMYFLYLYKNSLLITEFTKWMGLNITVTDAFPRTTIPSPCVRISLVLLVTSVLFLLMFLRLCDIKKALIVVIATIKASADFSFSLFADYTISHRTPPWIKGLLLRADGYECDFYKKD